SLQLARLEAKALGPKRGFFCLFHPARSDGSSACAPGHGPGLRARLAPRPDAESSDPPTRGRRPPKELVPEAPHHGRRSTRASHKPASADPGCSAAANRFPDCRDLEESCYPGPAAVNLPGLAPARASAAIARQRSRPASNPPTAIA